jgi:hypothetical protein
MQPSVRFVRTRRWETYFGERKNNSDHGRGITIFHDDRIVIGYFKNGHARIGNYIDIHRDGSFDVREKYKKDGGICFRGTNYKTNGTEMKYGLEW